MLFKLLASGISMRRSARVLKIHRTTVHRKLIYLAKKARKEQALFLRELKQEKVEHLQFDDLISSVHTKLKPIAISLVIDAKRRFILGTEVSEIPAFGHLAELSRRKYGRRKNEHPKNLSNLLERLSPFIHEQAKIESDEHYAYAPIVSRHFPLSEYLQYKSEKGCVAGQGELKKINYDPLFMINHTCAMLRANINRLIRKTWCTSKRMDMLKNHIDLFIAYYNRFLLD